MRILF